MLQPNAGHPPQLPCLHTAFPNNLDLQSKLCSTLAHLTTRNNYCQEVLDLGGLTLLGTLLATCGDHQVSAQAVPTRLSAGNPTAASALCLGGCHIFLPKPGALLGGYSGWIPQHLQPGGPVCLLRTWRDRC